MPKIKVLYIAGVGRSGTTLIDRLLGELDGFVSVGELRHIWTRSYQDNQLCGCQNRFHECETWKSISARAFPKGLTDNDLHKVIELQKTLNRLRMLHRLNSSPLNPQLASYINRFLFPLYRAIHEEFPGHVIVDSSKIPSYVYILSKCGFIDLSVIHVVRDPRAVAFSWLRKKTRPEVTERDEYMPTISPLRISIIWVLFNSLIKRLGNVLGKTHYHRVSYEDFTQAPYRRILELSKFMGKNNGSQLFQDSHSVLLGPNHSVSGNPMRFKTGVVAIKNDEQWKSAMHKFDKFVVSLLTTSHRKQFAPSDKDNV